MAEAVTIEIDGTLATVRICRENGNAINDDVVAGLMRAAQDLDADPAVRGVLLAASGPLFSPGLDVRQLVTFDRPAMVRFMSRFVTSVLMLYTMRKPLVAAIHGHAVAGGCVLTLTADWRILRRGCKVGLNEIRVGVPLPFGVSMILRESVNPVHLEEVALFGRNYVDERAVEAGLAHELHDGDGFEDHARERLAELAGRDPLAFSITKRYLRSATAERIRAHDPQFTREFVDAWFEPATQERIRALVERLGNSEG